MAKHGVLVSLSASVRGLVPPANISSDKRVTNNFLALFRRGMGVRAVVRSVEGEKKRLILSLIGESKLLCAALRKKKILVWIWFELYFFVVCDYWLAARWRRKYNL